MKSFPFDSEVTYGESGEPIYDRASKSQDLRDYFSLMYTDGVFPNPSTGLQVTTSTQSMSVTVKPGAAIIQGAFAIEDRDRTIVFEAADENMDRIDSVVIRLNTNLNYRTIDLYVVKGKAAAQPAAPALTREGGIYELRLANVFVAKGTTTISKARITDTRLNSRDCGIAACNPQKVETSTIYDQYQASLDEWLQYVADCIDGTTAGNLQKQISALNAKVPFGFGVDQEGNAGYIKPGEDHITLFGSGTVNLQTASIDHQSGNTATILIAAKGTAHMQLIVHRTVDASFPAQTYTVEKNDTVIKTETISGPNQTKTIDISAEVNVGDVITFTSTSGSYLYVFASLYVETATSGTGGAPVYNVVLERLQETEDKANEASEKAAQIDSVKEDLSQVITIKNYESSVTGGVEYTDCVFSKGNFYYIKNTGENSVVIRCITDSEQIVIKDPLRSGEEMSFISEYDGTLRVYYHGASYLRVEYGDFLKIKENTNILMSFVARTRNMVKHIDDFTLAKGATITQYIDGEYDSLEVGETYTFSADRVNVVPSTTSNNNLVFRCYYTDNSYVQVVSDIEEGRATFTFTPTKVVKRFAILISSSASDGTTISFEKFQLEKGNSFTFYVPYLTMVDYEARGMNGGRITGCAYVNNEEELKSAINVGCEIHITSDINLTQMIVFTKDCVIYGNGHKLKGNVSFDAVAKVNSGKITIYDTIFSESGDSTFVYQGDSEVYCYNCDFEKSYGNDGVSGKLDGHGYFYNCRFNDNYDEGISTHNRSYAELIDCEAFNNGYVVGSKTKGAPSSFGGFHLGGDRMGIVKNCYSHDNCTFGIGLIHFQNLTENYSEVCVGNIVKGNGKSGIFCTACYDLTLSNNTILQNGEDGIHFGIDRTGNPSYAEISKDNMWSKGYVLGNIIRGNNNDNIVIESGADNGIIM